MSQAKLLISREVLVRTASLGVNSFAVCYQVLLVSAIPWREHVGQMSKVCQRLHREILPQTFLVTKT